MIKRKEKKANIKINFYNYTLLHRYVYRKNIEIIYF